MKYLIYLSCILTSVFIFHSCGIKNSSSLTKDQETALYYLYNKSLIADTFARLAWELPVDCRGYDSEEEKLYFIFKRDVGRANVLKKFTIDSSEVEFAPCESGPCEFGGMRGNIDGYYAFCTHVKNLKVNTKKQFKCNLPHYDFAVPFNELVASVDSSITYNSSKYFVVPGSKYNHQAATNIGSLISKKNADPIIKRLAAVLTKDIKTNEEKAQKLLDFVSSEIAYSYEDYWYESEVTQRAHEVLISGEADCSGKSTLYASLLDQCDILYCLLYFDHHVNVGVLGAFSKENKLSFQMNKATYYMAETTVPTFKIGTSKLSGDNILTNVLFYQMPKESERVYNAATFKPLQMIEKLDEEVKVDL